MMKKIAFLILVGILWVQIPFTISEHTAPLGRLWVGNSFFTDTLLALTENALLMAVSAIGLALLFYFSNYETFSRREVAITAAPMALAGVAGLLYYSSGLGIEVLGPLMASSLVNFLVPVLVVPLYLNLFQKIEGAI